VSRPTHRTGPSAGTERQTCPAATRTLAASPRETGSRAESLRRWLLAILGMVCVALAAVGTVVPGMPTTVFLIAAAWLFTRSCPWLEQKLVRHRFFAPFHAYLEPDAPMPRRARIVALAAMWTAITVSVVVLGSQLGDPTTLWLVRAAIVAAGIVGTVVILRIRRGAPPATGR
jgi:uncharacterized membrane protein YbaN (DUF454 family)